MNPRCRGTSTRLAGTVIARDARGLDSSRRSREGHTHRGWGTNNSSACGTRLRMCGVTGPRKHGRSRPSSGRTMSGSPAIGALPVRAGRRLSAAQTGDGVGSVACLLTDRAPHEKPLPLQIHSCLGAPRLALHLSGGRPDCAVVGGLQTRRAAPSSSLRRVLPRHRKDERAYGSATRARRACPGRLPRASRPECDMPTACCDRIEMRVCHDRVGVAAQGAHVRARWLVP